MKRTKPQMQTWNYPLARALITELGLEREELAKDIGMTKASFTQILCGRKPGAQTIKLLSIRLGCPEDALRFPSRGRVAS